MEWTTPEYTHYEKGRDWYIAVLIIAAGLILAEILLKEILLIIVTILGTIAFLLVALRKPEDLHVSLEETGVRIQQEFYPYSGLQRFSLAPSLSHFVLILESTKRYSPYMIVPLGDDVDPEEVRSYLLKKIEEGDLKEPFSHTIFERLGF
jgi:hypothetical protein